MLIPGGYIRTFYPAIDPPTAEAPSPSLYLTPPRARAADDRRAIVVALTPKGRRRIAAILPAHLATIVEQMSVLTPAEQQQLGALCKKLGMAGGTEAG